MNDSDSITDNYVMIPNNAVQNLISGEKEKPSYIQLGGKKSIVYLRQLIRLQTMNNSIYFSSDLILFFSDIKSNIIRERKYFKDFLLEFNKHSFIVFCNLNCPKDFDLESFKASDFFLGNLNIYEYKDGNRVNFFMLMDSEYETIMNYSGNLDKYNLLNLFCNIKSRIKRNAVDISPAEREPEVAYPSYETIMDDIFIESHKTLKQYIDTLVELDLIRFDYPGDMIMEKNGQMITRKSNFTYTLFRPQWEMELENSISLLKSQKKAVGWKFRSKADEISADVKRSITQKINMLEKKSENNTLTQKDKKELAKLKRQQEKWKSDYNTDDIREIEEEKLKLDNPDKELSEIYDDMGFESKAERAFEQEEEIEDECEYEEEDEYVPDPKQSIKGFKPKKVVLVAKEDKLDPDDWRRKNEDQMPDHVKEEYDKPAEMRIAEMEQMKWHEDKTVVVKRAIF